MKKTIINTLFILLGCFTCNAANCIYTVNVADNNIVGTEDGEPSTDYDTMILHLNRPGFPALNIGQTYYIRLIYLDTTKTPTIHPAIYTYNTCGEDARYYDYGTLVADCCVLGFYNIISDTPRYDGDDDDMEPDFLDYFYASLTFRYCMNTGDFISDKVSTIEIWDECPYDIYE